MSQLIVYSASCVAIGNHALVIEGQSGIGKSTLALQLIDRGAMLVGDDGVTLEQQGNRLMASPPPNTAGLLEIRNVGIVELPTVSVPAALVIRLTKDAPRYVDQADTCEIGGCAIPLIFFDPTIAAAPVRAEYALQRYGLLS